MIFYFFLIRPQQINNDIYINLKNNLKKKVEKKCNKYGFITKIYKILPELARFSISRSNSFKLGKFFLTW